MIEKTLDGEEKMEEDLGFLFDNNASQKKRKKRRRDEKNKTAQHNQDKSQKFFDKFFV